MKTRKVVLTIIIIVMAYGALSTGISAYFTDDESSKSRVETDIWPGIDANGAILTGNGWTNLHNIWLLPGGEDIITDIIISWSDNKGEKVNEAIIGGHTFWAGTSGSGEILRGDYILNKKRDNMYRFDSDMHGKEFTIQFILDDGQIISKTFIPKWKDEKPEEWPLISDISGNDNNENQNINN